ncbi:MAG: hypothetical protein A3E00_09430 [Curvibacter sp. RIFCSPHIGHO2_12_FULL_63_18]|uniref:hypothetical protein n=1 Tax=Rhodoferax sp. TaxID=50421 RepID=UPI0008BA054D|nr:hypothetical protein [Rhodoferax sp.]OGO95276.1 MAG: hypothetical protein A2037_07120 [Curvibacter sp. GWA2_63_95]OGO99229.1 MAG: hypothetical protein A3E00_09430 [Curvibacter sp. RIFCSPHIGHO2_12_FULL_63_18]HCX81221.1 hypothetical protein [Rhodoferax sp.]
MKIPTDKEILETIFEHYKTSFADYEIREDRASKIYVPIDCQKIAGLLKTDRDIIFGRLYYHLERKHGYAQSDDSKVHFFALKVGNDAKCVNFPLLVSVLAGLQEEGKRFWFATAASFLSLGVAIGSLVVAIAALKGS